jgi:hypothetical protein
MGGAFGIQMKLLLDFAIPVEQQQPNGSLKYQEAFKACA